MDREARNKLVLDNLAIAEQEAKKALKWAAGNDYDDLCQYASEALILAANRYDPSTGVYFHIFARRCISMQLLNYVKKYGRTLRLPMDLTRDMSKIAKAQESGDLTEDELAEATGLTLKRVKECRAAFNHPKSLHTTTLQDGDELALGELIEDPRARNAFDEVDLLDKAAKVIAGLKPDERQLVLLLADGMTVPEAAKALGLCERRARETLSALRRHFAPRTPRAKRTSLSLEVIPAAKALEGEWRSRDLGQKLGSSAQVHHFINKLIDKGVVEKVREEIGERGRPRYVYRTINA